MSNRKTSIWSALFYLLFIGLLPEPSFAHSEVHPTRFVAENGVDKGSCADPHQPCRSIAYAVKQSGKGDKVKMASGTYHAKEMDIFYLLNDMVAISGGYNTKDSFKKQSTNNVTRIIGMPAEYRERLAKKGFSLLADSKGDQKYSIKPEYIKMLERYKKITTKVEGRTSCNNGVAGEYQCQAIDMLSHIPLSQFSSAPTSANDIWGYRDLNNDNEFALIGLNNGTAIFNITDPDNVSEVGTISGVTSTWRDIKVYQYLDSSDNQYKAYAYVTTEGNGGFQIIDLTDAPNSVTLANTINVFQTAHNVYLGNIDYASGMASGNQNAYLYIAGSNSGNGSYRIFDLENPTTPKLVTTPPTTGYVHDATNLTIDDARTSQCANGHNPCELFVDFNENTVDIWDTTDKSAPVKLSSTGYNGAQYTHSGWYSKDKNYIFVQDELDEQRDGINTTLYVMDISNLTAPAVVSSYTGPTQAIDHNGFTLGDKYYMSNYKRGLTVLDVSEPRSPVEIGFFDTYPIPAANDAQFNGAWGTFPYLASGNIIVSDISNGLFILKDNSLLTSEVVGQLNLTNDAQAVSEGNSVTINVSRTLGSKGAVSIDFATADDSATAGQDYTSSNGTISWDSGEMGTKSITINTIDDSLDEEAETFVVNLSNPQGGVELGSSQYTITINKSDTPTLVVTPEPPAESSGGGGPIAPLVLLSLIGILALRRKL